VRRNLWRLGLAVLLSLSALPGRAQQDLTVFFFGNSLIHHLSDSDETTVPHWLALMAREGGHGFAADGIWGFPVDFATSLPPDPNWAFEEVPRPMDQSSFRMAGFDTIVLNPANFIQDDPPGAEVQGGSAVDLTARVLDWSVNNAPVERVFLYEGWAAMEARVGYPPSARDMRRWHAWNREGHHAWYRDWTDQVQARLPDVPVALIPVASVLSTLLTEAPWDEIPPDALYSDGAPHGTATKYLLAAMVSYASLYGQVPPPLPLGETIHPLVRDQYPALAQRLFLLTTGGNAPEGAVLVPPATGLTDPSGGINLAGIADYSTQTPFLDLMKTARPWTGHLPGQWGGCDHACLADRGALSPEGWPLAIPDGVEAIEALVLTDLPPGAVSLAGRYVLRWAGQGEVRLTGLARDTERTGPQEWRFSFRPGPGTVGIRIDAVDPADPVRDITLVREDRLDLWQNGALFNPDWLPHVRDQRLVRFMDWMATNGSTQARWDDRPRPADYTWVWRGVPVEVMVRLANEIGADPWFTIPHQADDAYVTAFAGYVRDNLDPRLRVHAEWSNEVWNWIFPQAEWAAQQALARWGTRDADAWMQLAGTRAAEAADLWAAVFAGQEDRLTRVIAVHTGWPGLELAALDAPLRQAEGLPAPGLSFDAYAVTGYLGHGLTSDEMLAELRDWQPEGTATAVPWITDWLAEQEWPALQDLWSHHAQVAAERGLALIMYEGGSHLVPPPDDPALVALLTAASDSPQMAALYGRMLQAWAEVGQGPFTAFTDLGAPGRWGAWGQARWPGDAAPRRVTLDAWGSLPPAWSDPRPDGTFTHGLWIRGTDGPDQLQGTPGIDDLMAGPGDDLLAAGPGDRLHGGAGRDTAQLPGSAADWQLTRAGPDLHLAQSAQGTIRLTAIEGTAFAAEPGRLLPLPE
jgi:hypothetical protein